MKSEVHLKSYFRKQHYIMCLKITRGTLFFRMFWFVLVLCGILIAIFCAYQTIAAYLTYNFYETKSNMKAEPIFPAVIICDHYQVLSFNDSFCKFNSNKCRPLDFVSVHIIETDENRIHKCYKLNSGKNMYGNSIDFKSSSKKGIDNGLNLILYSRSNNEYCHIHRRTF